MGCVKITKRIVKLDSKQSYGQIAKGSEKILILLSHGLVKVSMGCVKIKKRIVKVLFSEKFQNVASAFSQRKLKLDSKQSYGQIAKGSEKILILLSHGLVKVSMG
ncbi:hypothetical protein M0802_005131 [Mischocyttarus mexicanus]|nr:hypothetical protein M0802_005131 [Mischocyttarus mexicanus]